VSAPFALLKFQQQKFEEVAHVHDYARAEADQILRDASRRRYDPVVLAPA
jgi:hypothetical protein